MKEVLLKLVELQKLDHEIDSLKKSRSELPLKVENLKKKISLQTEKNSAKKIELEDLMKNKRQSEAALQMNEERMKRTETKSSDIKNSTEFAAIQKEMEALKRNNAILEEAIVKAIDQTEVAQKEMAGFETEQQELMNLLKGEQQILDEEAARIDSRIKEIDAKKASLITPAMAPVLKQYDRIRSVRAGVAIGILRGNQCEACHRNVPAQNTIIAKKLTAVQSCPNCQRLLIPSEVFADLSRDVPQA